MTGADWAGTDGQVTGTRSGIGRELRNVETEPANVEINKRRKMSFPCCIVSKFNVKICDTHVSPYRISSTDSLILIRLLFLRVFLFLIFIYFFIFSHFFLSILNAYIPYVAYMHYRRVRPVHRHTSSHRNTHTPHRSITQSNNKFYIWFHFIFFPFFFHFYYNMRLQLHLLVFRLNLLCSR